MEHTVVSELFVRIHSRKRLFREVNVDKCKQGSICTNADIERKKDELFVDEYSRVPNKRGWEVGVVSLSGDAPPPPLINFLKVSKLQLL